MYPTTWKVSECLVPSLGQLEPGSVYAGDCGEIFHYLSLLVIIFSLFQLVQLYY